MTVKGKYCENTAKYESYIYNTRRMQVTFVTDYFVNKTGFSAIVNAVCGGELEGPNGEISTWDIDPDQRLAVHSGMVCEWHVKVRPGRTIQVQFDKLDIPQAPGKACGTDYVLLKNGETYSSPNLGVGKYCGTSIPVLPDTSSNHLYVKYPNLPQAS
ncbi:cubilin homolog [Nilaparvata lugens]|uniref:cubilin homolog n=1 Tax=Nilaparvata lugens TaxID=108931 RepID=UPI00193C8EBB|nr:cubilin homolog [Nilaparvata lugens]